MIRRLAASAALVLIAAPLLGAGTIPGLRASGSIVVRADIQGQPVNIGGKVALYHKGTLYRLDLLSLGFPGLSADLSAAASSLIGQGTISFVYDGANGATSAWSTANRTYYLAVPQRASVASLPPTAPPTQQAAPSGADPLAALANLATALRDVQTATIRLVGHATVNGHPATDLDVTMKRQLPGRPLEDYHARLMLADDLDYFPLQVAFESTAATPAGFGGALKIDFTTVQRDTPDDAVFLIPAGYTRVSSLAAIMRR